MELAAGIVGIVLILAFLVVGLAYGVSIGRTKTPKEISVGIGWTVLLGVGVLIAALVSVPFTAYVVLPFYTELGDGERAIILFIVIMGILVYRKEKERNRQRKQT